jgi:hypothetical protein
LVTVLAPAVIPPEGAKPTALVWLLAKGAILAISLGQFLVGILENLHGVYPMVREQDGLMIYSRR